MKLPILCAVCCVVLSCIQALASELIWETEFKLDREWSRLTADGSSLVATKDYLANYAAADGKQRWQREDLARSSPSDLYPIPGNDRILIEIHPKKRKKTASRVFEALDLVTGRTEWKLDRFKGDLVGMLPIEEHGLILAFELISSGKRDSRGLFIEAINAADGASSWRMRYGDHRAKLGNSRAKGSNKLLNYAQPLLEEGFLYLPYRGLHAIDLETGALDWGYSFSVPASKYRNGYAAPVISEGVIYAAGDGTLNAYKARDGKELWKSKLRGAPTVREILPIEEHGLIIARTGGLFSDGSDLESDKPLGIQAVEAATGKVRWRYSDAEGSLCSLHFDAERGHLVFADSEIIGGLAIEDGEIQYETPLVYWRLYGLFDEKQSGFSIGGGYASSVNGGPVSGGGGGLGMSSRKLDLGANPLSAEPWREEIIIRGPHYIVSFAPRVRVPQWAAIFSDTKRPDSSLLRTSEMPVFSNKGHAYYLTKLIAGRSGRSRETLVLLGIRKRDGKVMSRHDFRDSRAPFHIDHVHDRLYVFEENRKSTTLRAFDL